MKKIKYPEIAAILAATILRILLANLAGIWFPSSQISDDRLLVEYAVLPPHFQMPDSMSLVKTMSFPLFLDFVHLTGMTYSTVLAVIWAAAAGLAVYCFRPIHPGRRFLLFVYLFVLFTPSAFDAWIGTRLYRNSILAPFVLICFLLMLRVFFQTVQNKDLSAGDILCPSVFLGILFLFTYYIKEDGIWLLPCLCLALSASILIASVRFAKQPKISRRTGHFVRLTAALLAPLLIFCAGTAGYKAVNYHFFGVAEINTRTEGELGKFVSNVYKIESGNRTAQVWAPADAIQKAFDASETLQSLPDLEEHIMHTALFGNDIVQNPIRGDFLTWVLRTALSETGLWQSEKQVSDLFAQVNAELAAAFQSGKLQKDDSFQLVSSGGGRTFPEILRLKTPVLKEYASAVFLHAYEPGARNLIDYDDPISCEHATLLTHTNLLPTRFTDIRAKETETANQVIRCIFSIYSFLNPALFLLAAAGLLVSTVRLVRKPKTPAEKRDAGLLSACVLAMSALFCIGFLYSFSIAWFAEFVWLSAEKSDWILNFYSPGLVPLLTLFYLLGFALLLRNRPSFFPRRSSSPAQPPS